MRRGARRPSDDGGTRRRGGAWNNRGVSTLDARYGRRTRGRWLWPTVAAVGVLLGVAWAAWVALDTDPVSGEIHGYTVESPTRVVATLDVRRPDPVPARCTLYAQALDHSVVGERTVDVPAGRGERTRVTVPITTEREAVTAVVRTCQVLD